MGLIPGVRHITQLVYPAAAALLLAACAAASETAVVHPTAETKPVRNTEDAADDPAIWVDTAAPERSVVIGTDKGGGIAVYDLQGEELQYRPDGELNNVDLRTGFPVGARRRVLVAASDRTHNAIALYFFDHHTRSLTPAAARTIACGIDVYGFCLYRDPKTRTYYAFINDKEGTVQQWRLFATGDGQIDAVLVRTLTCPSQVEGCVTDDERGILYVGEEAAGIWRFDAHPEAPAEGTLVASTSPDGPLVADVEGLAIYTQPDGAGYLIASSQGNSTFVVFERTGNNAYLGTFRVDGMNGIDAVTGTDGIDVTATPVGPTYPHGLFVTQDDVNDGQPQNFKLIPWHHIATALGLE